MTAYADLADLPEDERIELMIHKVVDHKLIVGFFVDDEDAAERYIQKIMSKAPGIRIIDRMVGSKVFKELKGYPVVFVKIGPPLN